MAQGFVGLMSNYASNAIPSTLGFIKTGMSGFSGAARAGRGAMGYGKSQGMTGKALGGMVGGAVSTNLSRFGARHGNKGYAAMGTVGLGGAAAGYGAADFMNPWGLGWGD